MVRAALVVRMLQVLFKMLNRGVFDEINGCVSTGKEANVYHATARGPEGEAGGVELAIKVYKTAILVFKDRDRCACAHGVDTKGGRLRFCGDIAIEQEEKDGQLGGHVWI